MNHWTLLNALVYIFARFFKKPYVVCPAGALMLYGRSKFLKRFYNFLIGRRLIREADRCIAISSNEIRQFQTYGVDSHRITVIPNGIDSDGYAPQSTVAFCKKY